MAAMPTIQQSYSVPQVSGGTLGFSLGVASTPLLPANPQIQKVTFHNPGSQIVYVCQAFDMNGNALTPGPNPGNWEIVPGGLLIFTGNGAAGAWLGAAATGSGNPFTVAASQTP